MRQARTKATKFCGGRNIVATAARMLRLPKWIGHSTDCLDAEASRSCDAGRCLTRKCSRQAGVGRRSVRASRSQRPCSGSVDSCGRGLDRLQLMRMSLGGRRAFGAVWYGALWREVIARHCYVVPSMLQRRCRRRDQLAGSGRAQQYCIAFLPAS